MFEITSLSSRIAAFDYAASTLGASTDECKYLSVYETALLMLIQISEIDLFISTLLSPCWSSEKGTGCKTMAEKLVYNSVIHTQCVFT